MNERLTLSQVALLTSYALAMAGGQALFKLAATRFAIPGSIAERSLAALQSGYFIAGLALYLVLAAIWVWILSFTPLSRAYPFVAIAFAVTPLIGAMMFAEPLSTRLLLGIALVLCGLVLVIG